MGRWGFAFALAALLIVCAGCAVGGGASSARTPVATSTSVSGQGTVQDYATLVAALAAAGATAQPGEEHPPDSIFDAPSHDLLVNDSALLSVFEYATADAAKARAGC